MPKIVVSPFALERHWRPGPFTAVTIPPEELVRRVEHEYLDNGRAEAGYRPGVLLVSIDPQGILSPVHQMAGWATSEKLAKLIEVRFDSRREGEARYLHHVLVGPAKSPARHVDVVLYSAEVLAEDNERSDPEADWEVVSVNARVTDAPEPMTPMAMARNFLGLPGGSKAEYTAKQFAEAIVYWSDKVMVES